MKTIAADLRVLTHLLKGARGGKSSAEALDNFYAPQAEFYDNFRERLLQGREELVRRVPMPAGGVWLDLGAGTGFNLSFREGEARACRRIILLDLCRSLLEVADKRVREGDWTNVETVCDSVLQYAPDESVDLITLSYSLTMMPNWREVLERAHSWLKPGGSIGLVDFYVSPLLVQRGYVQHPWVTRTFWKKWFSWDGVHLNERHLPYLEWRFERNYLMEARAKVPYLPFGKVPYYIFVGQR
ncbi:MAG: class I SAM-dependent methyltransferase [Bdellovibrionaceae bacterium]|nr:class I SAM-dependent methyltransferase [Pseudobdellovibrionaceae bacterium]